MANQPSLEALEKALKIAARITVMHGQTYLPIFKRLHDEAEKMRDGQNKENLALHLAKQYVDME